MAELNWRICDEPLLKPMVVQPTDNVLCRQELIIQHKKPIVFIIWTLSFLAAPKQKLSLWQPVVPPVMAELALYVTTQFSMLLSHRELITHQAMNRITLAILSHVVANQDFLGLFKMQSEFLCVVCGLHPGKYNQLRNPPRKPSLNNLYNIKQPPLNLLICLTIPKTTVAI